VHTHIVLNSDPAVGRTEGGMQRAPMSKDSVKVIEEGVQNESEHIGPLLMVLLLHGAKDAW
jgi:hypothetical protein